MDNKIYNKVVTELQDPDTLKIELEGYGLYTNKAVSFIKGSNVYYAVLQNGSKGIENSIISPMKEVIGIMELIKEEHGWNKKCEWYEHERFGNGAARKLRSAAFCIFSKQQVRVFPLPQTAWKRFFQLPFLLLSAVCIGR